MINIYVGNLPYSQDDQGLQAAFEAFGEVKSSKVIKDMATGRSKGFGFVDMTDKIAVMQAIEALNDTDMDGHTDARPFDREERSNWELSAERANSARRSLAEYGYHPDKFLQVIGMADALPFVDGDPLDPQNRRISMTVMKESATRRILEPSREGGMNVEDLLDGPMGASGQGAGVIDTPEAGTPTDPDTSP